MPEQKACKGCEEIKPLGEFSQQKLGLYGRRSRCKACTATENAAYRERTVEHRAVYNAQWKREHPENHRAYNYAWMERNPEKVAAHRQLRNALRRGELARPGTCECCGVPGEIQAHHPDYSKPLEVDWLCAVCHAARR